MQGRRNWGAGGAAAPVALYQEGQGGAKVPFQFNCGVGLKLSTLLFPYICFSYDMDSQTSCLRIK
jgi:hypothetical protein